MLKLKNMFIGLGALFVVLPFLNTLPANADHLNEDTSEGAMVAFDLLGTIRYRFINRFTIEVYHDGGDTTFANYSDESGATVSLEFADGLPAILYDSNLGNGFQYDGPIWQGTDNISDIDGFNGDVDDVIRDATSSTVFNYSGTIDLNDINGQTLLERLSNVNIHIDLDEDFDPHLECGGTDDSFSYRPSNSSQPWSCNDGADDINISSRFDTSSFPNFNITYAFSGGEASGTVVFLGGTGGQDFSWCANQDSFRTTCGDDAPSSTFELCGSNGGAGPTITQMSQLGTGTGDFAICDTDGDVLTEVTIAGGESDSANASDEEEFGDGEIPTPDPTCESSIDGIGWLLCPVARFMERSLESMYGPDGLLGSILNFNSLEDNGQREALQSIWSGFRTIANVGFVIAFFVLIYSAASGGVLSAYDVKRLAPKLVVGAIMVQLSFFICMFLIRLFNTLGESVAEIMLAPIGESGVNSVFINSANNGFGGFLEGVVSFIVLLLLILGFALAITGAVLMLFVFILRNMALMVLTVVSPLAFVAWILPNTENLFKRWWGFYTQLLALFPIAMAFLSSGKLVAHVWASGDGGFANQWIGLIAFFLPYLMAPKMFSFAGSAVSGVVRGVEQGREGLKKNASKAGNSRIGKAALGGAASRVNRRYGAGSDPRRGIGRAMQRVAQMGPVSRPLAKGVQKRNQQRAEDAGVARTLQADARADGRDGQQFLRNIVRDGNATDQIAALERMVIDNDIEGIQMALEQGQVSATTWSQFLQKDDGKNESALHGKARHLTTGGFDQNGDFAANNGALAGQSADIIASSRAETIRQTLSHLSTAAAAPGATADDHQALDAFLGRYRDEVMEDPRRRGQMDPALAQQLDAAVRSRGGQANPQDANTLGEVEYVHNGAGQQGVNVGQSPNNFPVQNQNPQANNNGGGGTPPPAGPTGPTGGGGGGGGGTAPVPGGAGWGAGGGGPTQTPPPQPTGGNPIPGGAGWGVNNNPAPPPTPPPAGPGQRPGSNNNTPGGAGWGT